MDAVAPAGRIADTSIDALFREARTHIAWTDQPVAPALLRELYDIARMAPTSGNCNPMRVVFVMSPDGKERLRPALRPGNLDKTMAAPVTAIVGTDMMFHEHLPRLAPHAADMLKRYQEEPELAARAAFRNASLQGAYLILAARALGLDCGPMSGFDHGTVDRAFFGGTNVKSNFLINLGYGDRTRLRQRAERFSFDEACGIV